MPSTFIEVRLLRPDEASRGRSATGRPKTRPKPKNTHPPWSTPIGAVSRAGSGPCLLPPGDWLLGLPYPRRPRDPRRRRFPAPSTSSTPRSVAGAAARGAPGRFACAPSRWPPAARGFRLSRGARTRHRRTHRPRGRPEAAGDTLCAGTALCVQTPGLPVLVQGEIRVSWRRDL